MITQTDVIIRVDGDSISTAEAYKANLVIIIFPTRGTFEICKNRWGYSGDNELPLNLLASVLKNPAGKMTYGWCDENSVS